MSNFAQVFSIIITTLIIFLLTKNPITAPFKLQLTLIVLIILGIYSYLLTKRGEVLSEHKPFLFLLITFVLLLVGSTGWFFSPFFFSLYLLAIFLAFAFSTVASLSFVVTLVTLFSFNIGEVDLAYDFLVVLSLLTVIPISLYIRKEYLRLKEAEKNILILEQDKVKFTSKVEEILANKISNLAANLRQPINDLKLLGYRLPKVKGKEQLTRYSEKLITASEDALSLIRNFERESTGKELLSTPDKNARGKVD